MKAADLRTKTPDQLKEQLLGFKKEAFNLRFQQRTGEISNPSRIRVVRRSIAKIKTILNEIKNKEAANA
ncbi:MAG: 50S ribosomal protein L29 [Alphaproteobacteria bacterium CG11_big_fil_rev_8_21_14_0_20_44_7]|nr:MAG: 50S ribosomal protein L29 [Alphaproteobacteria bacterium CG11_big_fil_rev_8_21_14_0_20_44_7]